MYSVFYKETSNTNMKQHSLLAQKKQIIQKNTDKNDVNSSFQQDSRAVGPFMGLTNFKGLLKACVNHGKKKVVGKAKHKINI